MIKVRKSSCADKTQDNNFEFLVGPVLLIFLFSVLYFFFILVLFILCNVACVSALFFLIECSVFSNVYSHDLTYTFAFYSLTAFS